MVLVRALVFINAAGQAGGKSKTLSLKQQFAVKITIIKLKMTIFACADCHLKNNSRIFLTPIVLVQSDALLLFIFPQTISDHFINQGSEGGEGELKILLNIFNSNTA